jgi:cytochrome c oxidase assembly protein subunit 16
MPAFTSKSRNPNKLVSAVRRRPFVFFGLPFLSLVVASSYALQAFTSTRYELNDQKVSAVSKEDELGMNKDRKKVDIREEYYVSGTVAAESGTRLAQWRRLQMNTAHTSVSKVSEATTPPFLGPSRRRSSLPLT